MAIYVPIPDAEIAPESPVTSALQHKLRDNPLAIAEGDPSAPKIDFKAMVVAAGDLLTTYPSNIMQVDWQTTQKNGPGVICGGAVGVIRIKFSMEKGEIFAAVNGQLRFNGALIGPLFSRSIAGKQVFEYDYTLNGPGLIELFTYTASSSAVDYAGELAVYTAGTIQVTRENLTP